MRFCLSRTGRHSSHLDVLTNPRIATDTRVIMSSNVSSSSYLPTFLLSSYLRSIYLPETVAEARFQNIPVFQSRSPELCGWIIDVIEIQIAAQKQRGIIGIVIYAKEDGQVVERYVCDVSVFPLMKSSVLEDMERNPPSVSHITGLHRCHLGSSAPL
jgi:hypothetical protein